MKGRLRIGVALGAILAIGASAEDSGLARMSVAQVGTRHITVAELEALLVEARVRGGVFEGLQTLTPEGRRALLERAVDETLLAIAAREAGLDRNSEAAAALSRAADRALAEIYVRREREAIREPALRIYYREHPDEFRSPTRVRASHIVVKTRDEAERLRADLARGADLAALAREHNLDATRERGGDLGWVGRGVMVGPFERELFSLGPGETGGVVETRFGFHLVRVHERDLGRQIPFDRVSERVRDRLVEAQLADTRERVRKAHPVRVHPRVLERARP